MAKARKASPQATKTTKALPGWEPIATAVGTARGKLGIELPKDVEIPGVDVDVAAKALHLEVGKERPNGVVEFLRSLREIEGTALDAFGLALARAWADSKKDAGARWLVDAACAIGGLQTIDYLGGFLWERIRESSAHHHTTTVVKALSAMDAAAAAHEVLALAEMPSRYTKRREEARELFEAIAQRHGEHPQTLALTCAPRDVSPPWQARIAQLWARRFERMMVDGVRLAFSELAPVLEHPVTGPLASRLVLVACDKDKAPKTAFRAGKQGPVDAANKPVAVTAKSLVGVAHPVELQALGQLAPWYDAFASQDAPQPFAQLERTIRTLTEKQRATNVLTDFKRFRRDWLHEQSWWADKLDVDWMGDADHFVVRFERDRQLVHMRLASDGSIEAIEMGEPLQSWERARTAARPPFGTLHPVSQSELLYALYGQDARQAPQRAAQQRPADSRFPYAEKAKTSRSTCIQCNAKIEKDTIRVAVERQIDSDAYRGTSAGYLHPACVAAYPALAELADRDRVIAANSQIPWP